MWKGKVQHHLLQQMNKDSFIQLNVHRNFFIITVTIPETSHTFCENLGDFINHT
jgi:hypothetical protein